MLITASSLFKRSSSPPRTPSPCNPASPPTPTLSRPISSAFPMPSDPMAAAADGLSKLSGPVEGWPASVAVVAGDLFTCCGDDLGPRGEKTPCTPESENGVETGGEAATCGVRPCCDAAVLPGVGVAMVAGGALRGPRSEKRSVEDARGVYVGRVWNVTQSSMAQCKRRCTRSC